MVEHLQSVISVAPHVVFCENAAGVIRVNADFFKIKTESKLFEEFRLWAFTKEMYQSNGYTMRLLCFCHLQTKHTPAEYKKAFVKMVHLQKQNKLSAYTPELKLPIKICR